LFFKSHYGKLSYPMAEPPKELKKALQYVHPTEETRERSSIVEFRNFLTQMGLTMGEYKKLSPEDRERVKRYYKMWREPSTIALPKEDLPEFEKFLKLIHGTVEGSPRDLDEFRFLPFAEKQNLLEAYHIYRNALKSRSPLAAVREMMR